MGGEEMREERDQEYGPMGIVEEAGQMNVIFSHTPLWDNYFLFSLQDLQYLLTFFILEGTVDTGNRNTLNPPN